MSSGARARPLAARGAGALAWARGPLPWLAALLFIYLLAPIVAFLVRLGGGASSEPGMWSALATSLVTATISAAIVTLLGTPLAYLLARRRGALSRLLLALVALPLALPPLISGMLLLYVLGPLTFLGELFGAGLTDSRVGIVLAQTFVAAPFLIVAARAAFAAVDPALEDVAATLGHGRLARFLRVAVPAALPGIGAGIMLTWLRAFGEFGATLILAYHPYSLPVFTYVQFDETGLPATMAPIALALGAALIVLLGVPLPLPRRRRHRPARLALANGSSISRGSTPPTASLGASPTVGLSAPPSHGLSASLPPPLALDFALAKRLGDFSLEVSHTAQSPHLALLGPSGAGKTLTLRLIAGLVTREGEGRVQLGEQSLDALAPERRGIGYVPQQPALMPRKTVWSQVNFGVRAQPELAAWWLARLGLSGLEDRYPSELSGGQQRRVALARALAIAPRVLLLDEPFTGLDAPVRDRLRRDLRRLQREAGLSTVIVTHDPEEAALLAEDIVVIGHGRVLQAGPRATVFRAPRTPEVAALLGIANTHRGVVVCDGRIATAGVELRAPTGGLGEGSEVIWCVRPERVALSAAGAYEGELIDDVDLGATRELTVALAGSLELTLRTNETAPLALGQTVRVDLGADDISAWPWVGTADALADAEQVGGTLAAGG